MYHLLNDEKYKKLLLFSASCKVKVIFCQYRLKPHFDYMALTIMIEIFCGFHQSIQANARITSNPTWTLP
jgi:hypothetical protein